VTKEIMIVAGLLLASSPVAAQDVVVVSPPFERVNYSDLDLLSQAGSQKLEARIRDAAGNLCIEAGVKPLAVKRLEQACFKAAVADGLSQAQRVTDAQREGRQLATANILVRAK
jgi:UrcA family protein